MPFLDWINKSHAVAGTAAVPYHLLQFQSAHGDSNLDNFLIEGDNLKALKALLPFYRRQVKCIFIDPPYNTQSAFAHYDDKLEHSQWLSLVYPRLVLLRDLLAEDGSIWVTIDDNESHYLKVMMDEVFGRRNFVSNVVWEKSDSPRMDAEFFSGRHDHVIVFAKDISKLKLNKAIQKDEDLPSHYDKKDTDGRPYYLKPLRAMGQADRRVDRPTMYFPLTAPDGTQIYPIKQDGTDGRWRWAPDKVEQEKGRIDWTKGRNGWVPYFRIYADKQAGRPPETIWFHGEVGSNRTSKAEVKRLFPDQTAFGTPKPEGLLRRILDISTDPGDLVLDSFLGSGTTAAVAHKMGRRWIGIEMGHQAVSHCLPRLEKVVEGEQGGVSTSVAWQGGGGFRFYSLGEPVFDAEGGINPSVRFAPLAAYLWHFETGDPAKQAFETPFLGIHKGAAYYLLYNGILGDRKPNGGNVLTSSILTRLEAEHPHDGPLVIYGEKTILGEARLREARVTFKQIPYDIKAR